MSINNKIRLVNLHIIDLLLFNCFVDSEVDIIWGSDIDWHIGKVGSHAISFGSIKSVAKGSEVRDEVKYKSSILNFGEI